LKALRHEAPRLSETRDRLGIPADGPPLAQIVKTLHTQHGGKLSIARILRGTFAEGDGVIGSLGAQSRIAGLTQLKGVTQARIAEVAAGTAPDDVRLADLPGSGRGRGGIASKLASAAMATGCGVSCVIASGEDDGVIAAAVAGDPVGTRFAASGRAEAAFKMWLRHAKPAQGRVVVDAGAVRALIEKGTSLLPVGVVSCDGAFPAGEAVLVVGPDGREVGKGIADLSAEEIRAVRGMRSEEALGLLPGGSTEVIHRDRFAPAVR
jgi:glutamate 5-kinase